MTRSYVHKYRDIKRTSVPDGDPGMRNGRVYRKRYGSMVKDHKGMNNTKYRHHLMMSALDDPRGNHGFYIYGYDLSRWLE